MHSMMIRSEKYLRCVMKLIWVCFIWRFATPDVSSMTVAQGATIAGTQVDRGATRRPRRHSQRQRPHFLCRCAHVAG